MKQRILNAVIGRLSLRPPQAESLSRLTRSLEKIEKTKLYKCSEA